MIVIKIGGSVVDDLDESAIPDIGRAVKSGGAVIVHGGGKEVSNVSEKLGKEPEFVTSPGGVKSRYTDAETMEIFTMVMAGRINKRIVGALRRAGIDAVGISGIDAGTIRASRKKRLIILNERKRRQAIDGGYTGKITSVNSDFLKLLLNNGHTPVISPVALGSEYEFLNVDGDRAAAHVAGALYSKSILFVTNVDGLMIDGTLAKRLSLHEAKELLPSIGPGMEKKVLAATEALEMGVEEALIASGRRMNPVSEAVSHNGCTVIRG